MQRQHFFALRPSSFVLHPWSFILGVCRLMRLLFLRQRDYDYDDDNFESHA